MIVVLLLWSPSAVKRNVFDEEWELHLSLGTGTNI